jgi:N-acetylmuramoyl-L-alanine amidase
VMRYPKRLPILLLLSSFILLFIMSCSNPTNQNVLNKPYPSQPPTPLKALPDIPEVKKVDVIIDPGHGGDETGAIGKESGIPEKEINLNISLIVKSELESKGYIVHLTREKDKQLLSGDAKLDLSARAQLSAKMEAKVFVSIHSDQYLPDRSVHGTKVYYDPNAPFSEESHNLALMLHDQITQALNSKPLQVHENDFIILRENTVPAVLIELGFLTNKEEEQKLINPEYQRKAAKSIAQAIEYWLKQSQKTSSP